MKRFRILAGLSSVIVLILAAPVSAVTFEGDNGKIAFCKKLQETTNIWTMRPDGTRQQQFTWGGACEPVWSPDGTKMAFINSGGHLYSISHNGRDQRPLATEPDSVYSSPAWSPDGSRLAVVRTKIAHPNQSAIFSMAADGSHIKNLTGWSTPGQGYRAPSWAPDGTRIVYEHFGADFGTLIIKNRLTGATKKLTDITAGTHSRVSWSPSGKKILFKANPNETYTIWPDGTHRTVISDGESYNAVWSPDGTKIAFIEDFGDPTISISGADGSIAYIPIRKQEHEHVGTISWSPNGRTLAFTLVASLETHEPVSHIFTLHLQRNEQTKLGAGGGPLSWQVRSR